MYCNEMPAQNSLSGGSFVNIAGRVVDFCLETQSRVDQAGKLTFTVKNEKTGNFEECRTENCLIFPIVMSGSKL